MSHKSKHTPGPWEITINTDGPVHKISIRDKQPAPYMGFEIATINSADVVRREFNARLIAAAPEMFDMLKTVVDKLEFLARNCPEQDYPLKKYHTTFKILLDKIEDTNE